MCWKLEQSSSFRREAGCPLFTNPSTQWKLVSLDAQTAEIHNTHLANLAKQGNPVLFFLQNMNTFNPPNCISSSSFIYILLEKVVCNIFQTFVCLGKYLVIFFCGFNSQNFQASFLFAITFFELQWLWFASNAKTINLKQSYRHNLVSQQNIWLFVSFRLSLIFNTFKALNPGYKRSPLCIGLIGSFPTRSNIGSFFKLLAHVEYSSPWGRRLAISSVTECPSLNWKVGCSIHDHRVTHSSAPSVRSFTTTAPAKGIIQASACHQLSLINLSHCILLILTSLQSLFALPCQYDRIRSSGTFSHIHQNFQSYRSESCWYTLPQYLNRAA